MTTRGFWVGLAAAIAAMGCGELAERPQGAAGAAGAAGRVEVPVPSAGAPGAGAGGQGGAAGTVAKGGSSGAPYAGGPGSAGASAGGNGGDPGDPGDPGPSWAGAAGGPYAPGESLACEAPVAQFKTNCWGYALGRYTCVAGECVACGFDRRDCDGEMGCEVQMPSNDNCGKCGVKCADDQECVRVDAQEPWTDTFECQPRAS